MCGVVYGIFGCWVVVSVVLLGCELICKCLVVVVVVVVVVVT